MSTPKIKPTVFSIQFSKKIIKIEYNYRLVTRGGPPTGYLRYRMATSGQKMEMEISVLLYVMRGVVADRDCP